ncbi:glycosyltransferase family 39 protein [Bacteroidia bacterium]|nr:glycosyltransferase family 39 protein [Bacteroidia bacterium]MDB4107479.1 glycosyltransferase family 39 protein [Bacteroidia bacterium]MDB9881652.1 glycosyltransferase family 39 protein [Bacteroidia bacterium]
MPLAWVDEIAGLEPAINFLQGNGYTSKLWPQEGVEKQFMAYLPLQGWLHIIFQKIFSFSIYTIRLPYALFLVSGAAFLYKSLSMRHLSTVALLAVVMIILNEKSLFETTRAIRVEPISFLLLCIAYFGFTTRNFHITMAASALMMTLHPYLWPVAIVFMISSFKERNGAAHWTNTLKPSILWLYPAALGLFFLAFIHFNIEDFADQLLNQASRHENAGGIGTQLSNHFYGRFWPYYRTQPYIPFLVYGALLASVINGIKRHISHFDVALIATHIFWIINLGPMHRYNSVLIILSLFVLVPFIIRIEHLRFKPIGVLALSSVLMISCIDVSSRQVMAQMQRTERNPESFLDWLSENIPEGNTIIAGHEIAYYEAVANTNLDFFLFNTTPYRFDFEQYDNLLLISPQVFKEANIIAQYKVEGGTSLGWIKNSGTKTYQDLYLLKVKDAKTYQIVLTQMKNQNTVNNQKSKNR